MDLFLMDIEVGSYNFYVSGLVNLLINHSLRGTVFTVFRAKFAKARRYPGKFEDSKLFLLILKRNVYNFAKILNVLVILFSFCIKKI